jgi:uracil-DNA glycosylase
MSADASAISAFRALAAQTAGIDVEVYERFGKDPLEAIAVHGDPNARVGFFGRDPGRDEVQHGEPFIGAGGQLVRRALYQRLHGKPLPDFAASLAIGKPFFWANTVPYKPVGNKAWSTSVKKRFEPVMAKLLVDYWRGDRMITLGREAFLWFGLLQPREQMQRLEAFWAGEERFTQSIAIDLAYAPGRQRTLHLYPLPHPSPLNATWYGRFPGLLAQLLEQLDVGARTLSMAP